MRLGVALLYYGLFFCGCCPAMADADSSQARLSYEISLAADKQSPVVGIRGMLSSLAQGRYGFYYPTAYGAANDLTLIEAVEFRSADRKLDIVETQEGHWTVEHPGGPLHFAYRLRVDREAHRLTMLDPGYDEMPYADGTFLFLLGELAFMRPETVAVDAGIELRWNLPEGWSVFTPWEHSRAPELASLLDNYLIAARNTRPVVGRVGDFTYQIVWPGRMEPPFSALTQRRLDQAFRTAIQMFGGRAVRPRYLVIIKDIFPPGSLAGSPKRDSIQISVPAGIGADELAQMEDRLFYRVLLHEFFHTWTAGVFKDDEPSPSVESPSDSYWLAEGFNDYLSLLALAGARLLTPEALVATLYQRLAQQTGPDREAISLVEASRRFFTDPVARQRSYDLGALLALDLDLRLRQAGGGGKTLRDFIAFLIERGGVSPTPLTAVDDAWRAFAPEPLKEALPDAIRKVDPIDGDALMGMLKAERRLVGYQTGYDAAAGEAGQSPDPVKIPRYEWSIQKDSPVYELIGIDPMASAD